MYFHCRGEHRSPVAFAVCFGRTMFAPTDFTRMNFANLIFYIYDNHKNSNANHRNIMLLLSKGFFIFILPETSAEFQFPRPAHSPHGWLHGAGLRRA